MATSLPPELKEKYRLVHPLGSGASGWVFLVEDRKFERQLALKLLLKPGDERMRRRFLREAEALAGLKHENLPRVYDHGMAGEVPYLAMEFLDGDSLQHPPSDLDAVGCMLQVASGLEEVHAAGLIHRDVKPSNIVRTRDGRSVLVDFGLVFDPDRTALTRTGVAPGTLAFQAPEILRTGEVLPASDWYAWGVSLFELLEGELPFKAADVLGVTGGRSLPALRFRKLDPSSPEAALLRAALSEDPSARPRSRKDVEDLLAGRGPPAPEAGSTGGHRPLPTDSLLVQVRRQPMAVLGGAAFLVLAGWAGWNMAAPPLVPPVPTPPPPTRPSPPPSPVTRTPAPSGETARTFLALEDFEGGALFKDELTQVLGLRVGSLGYLPGGWLYFAGFDDAVGILDPTEELVKARFEGHEDQVQAVTHSADGKWIASCGWDRKVLVWEAETRKPVQELRAGSRSFYTVAFSPDASLVAAGGDDHDVFVWEVASGKLVARLEGLAERTVSVLFYPDGSRVVAGGIDARIVVWDLKTGLRSLVVETPGGIVSSLVLSPDGSSLISGHLDRTIRIWDPRTLERRGEIDAGHAHLIMLRVTPDGRTLLSGSFDGSVRRWNIKKGRLEKEFDLGGARLLGMALSGSGTVLATLGDDRVVRFWDHRSGAEISRMELRIGEVAGGAPTRKLAQETGRIVAMDASRDGTTLAVGLNTGRVLIRTLQSGRLQEGVVTRHKELSALTFGALGRVLVTAGKDRTLRLRDLRKRKDLPGLTGHRDWVTALSVGPKGRRLVSVGWAGDLRLWDLASRRLVRELAVAEGPLHSVSWSPEGERLVVGVDDGRVLLWKGKVIGEPETLGRHKAGVTSLAFSPGGERLASGGADGSLFLWDARSGALQQTVDAHPEKIAALAFLGRADRLASAGWDGAIRVWQLGSRSVSRVLSTHEGPVEALVPLRSDGFLSGGWDGALLEWGR